MKQLITCAFVLSCLTLQARDYNILDYGASQDTLKVQTVAINAAIEACHRDGGGRVVIPAGKFCSGTIFLKDNVELHFDTGAYLYASPDNDDFPIQPKSEYRSLKDAGGWTSLIFAEDVHNISITGQGIIDGRGKGRKGFISGVAGDCNGRPRNILFISCFQVRVRDVEMRNSAMWNQHYLDCEDVIVDGIKVYNHCNGNNDGIDIDGCRNFILTNSIIDSDDDAIVLKSTGTAPCEDVIISNCIAASYANAIKCGTESTGGFRRIHIHDCIVRPSSHTGDRVIKSTPTGITAISLEEVDGGVMEYVTVDNILIEGTECPIYVRLADRGRRHIPEAPEPQVGRMEHIHISHIEAYNCGNFGSSITGIPSQRIQDITLSDIHIINRGGLKKGQWRRVGDDADGKRHDMAGNRFSDRYWRTAKDVKEDEKGYPQPTVWGNLPSYGLFVRHVDGITLRNVHFETIGSEPRKQLIFKDTVRNW